MEAKNRPRMKANTPRMKCIGFGGLWANKREPAVYTPWHVRGTRVNSQTFDIVDRIRQQFEWAISSIVSHQ